MIYKPQSLDDVIERRQTYDIRSWIVIYPTGGTSGHFSIRDEALQLARELWPNLPEDR